jgi:hypothetical protein
MLVGKMDTRFRPACPILTWRRGETMKIIAGPQNASQLFGQKVNACEKIWHPWGLGDYLLVALKQGGDPACRRYALIPWAKNFGPMRVRSWFCFGIKGWYRAIAHSANFLTAIFSGAIFRGAQKKIALQEVAKTLFRNPAYRVLPKKIFCHNPRMGTGWEKRISHTRKKRNPGFPMGFERSTGTKSGKLPLFHQAQNLYPIRILKLHLIQTGGHFTQIQALGLTRTQDPAADFLAIQGQDNERNCLGCLIRHLHKEQATRRGIRIHRHLSFLWHFPLSVQGQTCPAEGVHSHRDPAGQPTGPHSLGPDGGGLGEHKRAGVQAGEAVGMSIRGTLPLVV